MGMGLGIRILSDLPAVLHPVLVRAPEGPVLAWPPVWIRLRSRMRARLWWRHAAAAAHHDEALNMKHILVVDDEPRIAEIARDYLQRAGFAVTTAGNGDEGPAAVPARRPD